MFQKLIRFSMFGMMAVIAPVAFAGCVAPGSAAADDEVATEGGAGDEVASEEVASREVANVGTRGLAIEIRNVTCNSGWPGTRGCDWVFVSPGAIVPNTITVQVNGNNGEIGHAATQLDASKLEVTASVHEGDAFNPGKNTTSYTVVWLRN